MTPQPITDIVAKFPRAQNTWVVLARVGSDSHGTKVAPSSGGIDDTDYMGIIDSSPEDLIGFGHWDHWVYPPDENGLDVTLYSLRKFVGLLLKQNPNVLSMLWMSDRDYIVRTPSFDRLLTMRSTVFRSKLAYTTFMGYANSQFQKMTRGSFQGYMGDKRKRLVEQHGYDTKNASHLIRLLRMGIEFLATGYMRVDRSGVDASQLVDIKQGKYALEQVKQMAENLFEQAQRVRDKYDLPDEPDYEAAERYLMDEHRRVLHVDEGGDGIDPRCSRPGI